LIAPQLGLFTDDQFAFEILYESSFVVVTGAQNPWVRRRRITLAELMNESWVLPLPEHALGSIYAQAFRASGLNYPRTTVATFSPEVRMSLLATGRFLTIFPDAALSFPTKRLDIKVLPVELPISPVPNGIVTVKNRTLSPVARLFIEHAREVAKPLAKKKGGSSRSDPQDAAGAVRLP
jgi:DNA-binding transcriptional LysR family regulator